MDVADLKAVRNAIQREGTSFHRKMERKGGEEGKTDEEPRRSSFTLFRKIFSLTVRTYGAKGIQLTSTFTERR